MNYTSVAYHNLLLNIIQEGYVYLDKSRGINCKQISTNSFETTMNSGTLPVITTKNMYFKGIVGELLWFLRGDNNIKYLNDNNIHIWDKDASNFSKSGDVGRNYGVQWRKWTTTNEHMLWVDQIRSLIYKMKEKPMCRRLIVTAWNPAELHETALPPCHWSFEIIVRPVENPENSYSFILKWHQRSVDTFLGLPFNITSYSILAKIIEQMTGYICEGIIGDLSNVHLYEPHIELAKKQLENDPYKYPDPTFKFSDKALERFKEFREDKIGLDTLFESLEIEDFILENYNHYPTIKANMYEPK